jgi:predicted HTH domain antitoxin
MTVTVQIPPEVEQRLRSQTTDLDAEAKEAMLVEFYRQGKLSHNELAQALGLARYETDGLLKRHNVTEDSPSLDEIRTELDFLDRHPTR